MQKNILYKRMHSKASLLFAGASAKFWVTFLASRSCLDEDVFVTSPSGALRATAGSRNL